LNAQVQVQQLQDKTKNSREEIQRGNREKKKGKAREGKGTKKKKKESDTQHFSEKNKKTYVVVSYHQGIQDLANAGTLPFLNTPPQ
jgi:hypothetical protein